MQSNPNNERTITLFGVTFTVSDNKDQILTRERQQEIDFIGVGSSQMAGDGHARDEEIIDNPACVSNIDDNDDRKCNKSPKRSLDVEVKNKDPDLSEKPKRKNNKKIRAQLPSKEEINRAKIDPPPIPAEVQAKIIEKGGTDIKLVMQKYIYDTDVKPYEGRLSISDVEFRHDNDSFLTNEEKAMLNRPNDDKKKKHGISVLVLDLSLGEWTLELKRWKCYVLVKQWNKLVSDNEIRSGDVVQLYSFRYDNEKLGFAIVRLTR